MNIQALQLFIKKSQNFLNCGNTNFRDNFIELAQQQVPSEIFGNRQSLHDADYRLLLYSWFVESICDFERLHNDTEKVRVWSWVESGLNSLFPGQKIENDLIGIITEELFQKFVLNNQKKEVVVGKYQ